MKLKYNCYKTVNGKRQLVTEEIPLTTKKPAGKRLAVRHNGQNYYAALVETSDASASNLRTVFNGIEFAIQQQQLPQITDLTITPPTLTAMQGQSATATVTALANEQVAGLSYSLDNPPTWITISDDVILIEPSDNDLGQAVVQVYARDTGSDASASAPFVAEALLRPIIESLYVIPPAVTVQQGQSAVAGISAVANAAVTGLSYSLGGNSSWVSLDDDTIYLAPTDNDLGDNTVNVVAFDTNSSASATTTFVATAALRPKINSVTANPTNITVGARKTDFVTLLADANSAVTDIQYSLADAPDWLTLGNNIVTIAPTNSNVGTTVTVTAIARDTGSSVEASTQFIATADLNRQITTITQSPAAPQITHTSTDTANTVTVTLSASGENINTNNIVFSSEDSHVTIAGRVATISNRPNGSTSNRQGRIDYSIRASVSGTNITTQKTLSAFSRHQYQVYTTEENDGNASIVGAISILTGADSVLPFQIRSNAGTGTNYNKNGYRQDPCPYTLSAGTKPYFYGDVPIGATVVPSVSDSIMGVSITSYYGVAYEQSFINYNRSKQVSVSGSDPTGYFHIGRTSNDSCFFVPNTYELFRCKTVAYGKTVYGGGH